MKLKTLKDIDDFNIVELKNEAIKWIKFTKTNFENRKAVIDWIKHFFNITEEDLK